MRRIFKNLIILSILLGTINFALSDSMDDINGDSSSGVEGLYKSIPTVENGFAGQKQITDEEFEKTYQKLKSKKDKKLKKNQPFKGEYTKNSDGGSYLQETAEKNILLGLPVTLLTPDGDEIPVGHYRISAEK